MTSIEEARLEQQAAILDITTGRDLPDHFPPVRVSIPSLRLLLASEAAAIQELDAARREREAHWLSFSAQSRKLHHVLNIPGVREALAELAWETPPPHPEEIIAALEADLDAERKKVAEAVRLLEPFADRYEGLPPGEERDKLAPFASFVSRQKVDGGARG